MSPYRPLSAIPPSGSSGRSDRRTDASSRPARMRSPNPIIPQLRGGCGRADNGLETSHNTTRPPGPPPERGTPRRHRKTAPDSRWSLFHQRHLGRGRGVAPALLTRPGPSPPWRSGRSLTYSPLGDIGHAHAATPGTTSARPAGACRRHCRPGGPGPLAAKRSRLYASLMLEKPPRWRIASGGAGVAPVWPFPSAAASGYLRCFRRCSHESCRGGDL